MAGSAKDPSGDAATEHGAVDRRLEDLRRKLDQTKEQQDDRNNNSGGRSSALGLAVRAASELVAAVLVGVAIGWGLDWWLNTSPILLLIFFFFGFAAGVLNVVRAMKQSEAEMAKTEDGSKTN